MASLRLPSDRVILDSLGSLFQAFRVHSLDVQRRMGLSAAELFVLQQIQELSPVPLKALAAQTFSDAESVSKVVKGLAAKGLIEQRRSGKDGRLLELWLSPEGKLKMRQCPDSLQVRFIQALKSLGDPERSSLASNLEDLMKSVGISGGPAATFFDHDEAG